MYEHHVKSCSSSNSSGTDIPEANTHESGEKSLQNTSEAIEAFCLNIMIAEGNQTVEDFIKHQPTLTENEVNLIQENTVGQSSNPFWYNLRKDRITAFNFYAIHAFMNSF